MDIHVKIKSSSEEEKQSELILSTIPQPVVEGRRIFNARRREHQQPIE